jgi:glycosyltransferase involved in cell wall biosynthesis
MLKFALILLLPLQALLAADSSFVIIIPSYNNVHYCNWNLTSVARQTYKNYRIIYVDDCSSDGTFEKAESLVAQYQLTDRTTLIKNEKRCLAVENIYKAVLLCDDKEIIVMLDGDDWFYDASALEILNNYYSDPEVWMTFGSYVYHPSYTKGECVEPIPAEVIAKNSIRKHVEKNWILSHLKTCYAGLFKKIKVEDLKWKGKFFESSYDQAFMLPMVEMAGTHALCVPEILYVNNRSNPINDDKWNKKLQQDCMYYIRALPPYKPLKELFPADY